MTTNIVESLKSQLIDTREYFVSFIFDSIAHRFGELFRNRYANVSNLKYIFVLEAKRILRENMTEYDTLYVYNIYRSINKFTIIDCGPFGKFNLLKRLCFCRCYDLLKFSSTHVMTTLRLKHWNNYGVSINEYSLPIYSKSYTSLHTWNLFV